MEKIGRPSLFWTRCGSWGPKILWVWLIFIVVIIFSLASENVLCYAPVNIGKRSETAVMTMRMTMNTAAAAQGACAASSCAAMNCIIAILDAGLLLASLILLAITGRRMTVHRSPSCRLCCKG